jgi:CBS domain-containing protein
MRIAKLLEDKGAVVFTIGSTATLAEAVRLLNARGIGALVVSDDGRKISGIVSERDIVRALSVESVGEALARPVSSVMSSAVSTCRPQDDTDQLMATMTNGRFRHVPVVDSDDLVGIVSIGDVVRVRIEELERERKELVDYINAR